MDHNKPHIGMSFEQPSTKMFLSNGKSLLYLGRSFGLQNEIYLDETHCVKHLNEKYILWKLFVRLLKNVVFILI